MSRGLKARGSEESTTASGRGAFTSGQAPRFEVEAQWPCRPARAQYQDGDAGVKLAVGGGDGLALTRASQTTTTSAPRSPSPRRTLGEGSDFEPGEPHGSRPTIHGSMSVSGSYLPDVGVPAGGTQRGTATLSMS